MTTSVKLRSEDGVLLPIQPARWHGRPTATDELVLGRVVGPVLDVGCGPGRILDLLAQRGTTVLGVDPAPAAVALARSRGCAVLQRSVFDRLPLERSWGTILLLDGNIGIGGDPVRLLERCGTLVHHHGTVLVELEPPPTTWRRCLARLERGDASAAGSGADASAAGSGAFETSAWFPWAVVGAAGIEEVATIAGLAVASMWETAEDRWFAALEPLSGGGDR